MTEMELLRAILDSYPYAIVYVDSDFIIRHMNRYARYHYCVERGYGDLIDKSLFDCRAPQSREKIADAFHAMQKDGKERFIGINARNLRIYMQPVRDLAGKICGFFERFELNLQK